jgi:uncharacterized membrane protein YhaH (DUF805 family)
MQKVVFFDFFYNFAPIFTAREQWTFFPVCENAKRIFISPHLILCVMEWFIKCLKQYADFSGRARRKEYWMFTLFVCIFWFILLMIMFTVPILGFVVFVIFALGMIVPNLAVLVRRLHDVGKSGWMYLIVLIPLAGGIWLFVLMCLDSQPGANKWGANPKEASAAEQFDKLANTLEKQDIKQ